MIKKFLLVILAIIVLFAVIIFIQVIQDNKIKIESFEDCVNAGNPVMEIYPRQCRSPEGETFIEDIGNELEKLDIIRINTPRPNQIINSPFVIEGEARGNWFFEGDFPIKLLDANNNVIKISFAQALDEWMVEDFVPFKAEIEFTTPITNKGTLILEKDNPSGLPEYADELRVPIKFNNAF